ncbi:hypothetical protein B0A50_00263 [Salinomyces thailandicus]|uniref:J domain-containing protein n=1 Tax=Salinomyces thailandicus TaxID=706561 RepID=A0A4U0UFG6_9PEZI|nr:hypothetical protein B0A50_00263 [Salinomyces thailandica]
MVKADIKRNYYADLELPATCSIDDVKKQYRKLALLYHPDRNAGKEDEYVPKFQAIQTAHEVLGDPTQKAKYDADRRKVGLYSTPAGGSYARPAQPTGNPYQASSAYPPPPRRTQPGTWQRPQPASAAPPSGADRFSNFPRGTPTARKDPTQDRTNMFKAWQNMNNAQERQQRATPSATPGGAPPTPNRPRPPPRQDTKLPSEDEIRAGMNYRKAPPQFEGDRTEKGQSAWANFQNKNQGKPGVSRSNTTKTPRKQGFDPNAPGSDERPASGNSSYAQRHRSEDFGRPQPGQAFPPPPPGPPPQSPLGTSPTARRPFADPLRPFKSRTSDDETPYSEGNRKRTPYSSFVGERTHFQRDEGEDLRRSASTRDATKLDPNSANTTRARSTSPLGRHTKTSGHSKAGTQRSFVPSSDSEGSEGRSSSKESEGVSSGSEHRSGSAPHTTASFDRPKKIPTPRGQRFSSSTDQFSPPPASGNGQQGEPMQQKTSNNMYVNHSPSKHDVFKHSPFSPGQWADQMFGGGGRDAGAASTTTSRPTTIPRTKGGVIPDWAYPSSVQPGGSSSTRQSKDRLPSESRASTDVPDSTGEKVRPESVDVQYDNALLEEKSAYRHFCEELEMAYGALPATLDMSVFLVIASTAAAGEQTGHGIVDTIMDRVLSYYPQFAFKLRNDLIQRTMADTNAIINSFTFPVYPDLFTPNGRNRSTENINTQFSPEGWSGEFKGSGDYFAPPAQPNGRKASSPFRREKASLRSNAARNASAQANGDPTDTGNMPPPPPPPKVPLASDGGQQQQADTTAPGEVRFSQQEWEQTFQEPTWAWPPPPPPKPPSPNKIAKAKGQRKASKATPRSATAEAKNQAHVADEDANAEAYEVPNPAAFVGHDDGDAMDIDTPPIAPEAPQVEADQTHEPRLMSVPPSQWRQRQQAHANGNRRKASHRVPSAETPGLKTNLDDLYNVEPMARTTDGGLRDLSDLSSTLPFQSQPSSTLPTQSHEPQKLAIPQIPKAPESPSKLSKQSWYAYAQAFGDYLKAFHAFNQTMIHHFASREQQAQARFTAGMGWLEAVGDPVGTSATEPVGFGSYLQGVREDESVREAWSMGCERHEEACKGFGRVRERVRKVAEGGGLVER